MKKKYYLTLDTETATLPFVNELCKTATQKQKIAIAKPLVYDIAWCITDRKGNEIKRVSYLVQETFFVPQVFNTAYYKNKRPLYMEKLAKGQTTPKLWNEIIAELLEDLQAVDFATAYNATFDFKKAIPFTDKYIYHLYNEDYQTWENKQKKKCEKLLKKGNNSKSRNPDFLDGYLHLRNEKYPICDLWSLACKNLINNKRYKNYCLNNDKVSPSGCYFSTNAETVYQYLLKNYEFEEEHTALEDTLIECQILTKILKKSKIDNKMQAFPFKMLGNTIEYIEKETKSVKQAKKTAETIEKWLLSHENSPFWRIQEKNYEILQKLL